MTSNNKLSKSAGDYFDELPLELKQLINNSLQFNDINSTSNNVSKQLYQIKKKVLINSLKLQINFILPTSLRNSKDKSIIKDLIYYRNAYEKEAKIIKEIIDCTNELNEQLYEPLLSIHDDLKKYKKRIIEYLVKIINTFKSKKQGLNIKDIRNKDKNNEYNKNVEAIENQLVSYIEEANNFLENFNCISKGIDKDFKLMQDPFNEFVESVKSLRKVMIESIETFENISPKFEDLNDHVRIQKALSSLIYPFIKIIELINKSIEKLKEFDGTTQKGEIQYDNFVEKMKTKIEQLNNISKIIAKKINETRETINFERLDLLILELGEESIQHINSINSMKKNIDKTKEEIKKKLEDLKKKTDIFISQTSFDILFIIDSTNSINIFLDDIKKNFLNIIDEIIIKHPDIIINVGLIAYKDFSELDLRDEYLDIDFIRLTENPERKIEIFEKIINLQANGGGDICEDLAGAFELSLKKSWKGISKFAILATDAPCHGIEFHSPEIEDYYPKGDPKKRDIKKYIKEFAEREISLFCIEYDGSTKKMFGIFKEIYNETKKKDSNCQLTIQSGEDLNLSKEIIEKAIKIHDDNRKLLRK